MSVFRLFAVVLGFVVYLVAIAFWSPSCSWRTTARSCRVRVCEYWVEGSPFRERVGLLFCPYKEQNGRCHVHLPVEEREMAGREVLSDRLNGLGTLGFSHCLSSPPLRVPPWTFSAGPLEGHQEAGMEPPSGTLVWRPLGLSSLSEDHEGVSTSVCRVLNQLLVSQR